jgi:hypothetical protein
MKMYDANPGMLCSLGVVYLSYHRCVGAYTYHIIAEFECHSIMPDLRSSGFGPEEPQPMSM